LEGGWTVRAEAQREETVYSNKDTAETTRMVFKPGVDARSYCTELTTSLSLNV